MPPVATLFAACSPGLEPVLAGELTALGLEARPRTGGVEARGEDAVALACLAARTAEAVLLRLYDGPEAGVAAALREARRRAPGAEPAVRREGASATVSLDAAGAPLHRRGWRARVGAAPLRETLAAGLLLAAGYDGEAPLLDPMCGAGTLALEAAALASRRAPGLHRRFAFERWPGHDAARTDALRRRLAAAERAPPAPIHASDRNAGALRLAAKNAASGGFERWIRFARADAAAVLAPPRAGLVSVNPPYGIRLDAELHAAWEALATLLARLPGWRAAVLAPPRVGARFGERPIERELLVSNGGVRCALRVHGRVPAG